MNAKVQPLHPIVTKIPEYSATAQALAELEGRYKSVVYDVTTKEGMAAAKAARKELRGLRVALEDKRKEIKAPALERSRLIDAYCRADKALEDAARTLVDCLELRDDGRGEGVVFTLEMAPRERG